MLCQTGRVRQWLVAGGLVEREGEILLVRNRRRNGSLDWSPPGGVIEVAEGESLVDGLTREVAEETGIIVTAWSGPVYEVLAVAEGLGWSLRAEVHRAVEFHGDLLVEDPDGIVVDARFVPVADCSHHLRDCPVWVSEPFGAWLTERFAASRVYSYRLDGDGIGSLEVVRTG
jgi:8-oxo-dGTP diphosphatase